LGITNDKSLGIVMKLHTLFAAVSSIALLSVSAQAADMAVRAARAPAPSLFAPVPISMWNGLYIGVNGGGGWGTSDHTWTINGLGGSTGDFDVSGGLIGITAGVNQNMGSWIWGVEADIDGANIQGSQSFAFGAGLGGATLTSKLESLGTVRGRIGLNEGSWFPYVTGGLAAGSVRGTAAFGTVIGLGGTLSDAQMRYGWTIGGGVEYQFTPALSLKGEYLYVDLGNQNNMLFDQVNFTTSIFRGGLNYKLNLQ
jgi:outer membrane immunogenic protein